MDIRICERFSQDQIRNKVNVSLKAFQEHDWDLLQNDVNERSISHKLAIYLQNEFKDWHVDCEYNRDGHEPKRLKIPSKLFYPVDPDDTEARTVFPDIIVHHRSTNENLLVIEIKKTTSNVSEKCDLIKLKAYKEQLGYCYALFLKLRTGNENGGAVECEEWI